MHKTQNSVNSCSRVFLVLDVIRLFWSWWSMWMLPIKTLSCSELAWLASLAQEEVRIQTALRVTASMSCRQQTSCLRRFLTFCKSRCGSTPRSKLALIPLLCSRFCSREDLWISQIWGCSSGLGAWSGQDFAHDSRESFNAIVDHVIEAFW